MNTLFGLNVMSSPYAREVRDEWRVEPHPIRKKRRNWNVVKHHIDKPAAYQIGDTLVMHPDLLAALRKELAKDSSILGKGPWV